MHRSPCPRTQHMCGATVRDLHGSDQFRDVLEILGRNCLCCLGDRKSCLLPHSIGLPRHPRGARAAGGLQSTKRLRRVRPLITFTTTRSPLPVMTVTSNMEDLGVPGLQVLRDFITPEHEQSLLCTFRTLDWPSRSGRLSIHWGYTFSYKTFGIDPDTPFRPFPSWLPALFPPNEPRAPDQVCLQYYPPGTGIPPHADTHSVFDQLYALSFGAPVMMVFREGNVNEKRDIDLEPRALVRLGGDSRLHWSHGIRTKKRDTLPDGTVRERGERWSLTYRWLRPEGVCECGDVRLCDTAQAREGVEREYRWKQAGSAAEVK